MQAQLQLALQNPRRFHFVCSVRRQAKTLSSTDMTSLCTNWRSDEANAFLSAHSSTTQLVHGDGDENGNVDGNAGSAFTLECLHASHWRLVPSTFVVYRLLKSSGGNNCRTAVPLRDGLVNLFCYIIISSTIFLHVI
uniref:Uncharacterized protein n=1 Tax=Echinococcus granulosus TaxID=6210 RepID=U6FRA3_ECHGR|nr:hypothetical protein EgrG_002010900 [Echinococcus granulosus]